MAITLVAQGRDSGTLSTGNGTLVLTPGTLTDGSWLVIGFCLNSESYSLTSVTTDGTESMTFTALETAVDQPSATGRAWLHIGRYVAATHGTVTTITWDTTGTNQSYGSMAIEVQGADSSDAVDGEAMLAFVSTSGPDSGTGVLCGNPGLAVSFAVTTATMSPSAISGWTLLSQSANPNTCGACYSQASTAGNTYTAQLDISSGVNVFLSTILLQDPLTTTPTLNARAGEVQVGYSDLAG